MAGIEVKFKNMVYPVILAPAFIPELNAMTHTEDGEKDTHSYLCCKNVTNFTNNTNITKILKAEIVSCYNFSNKVQM